MFNSVERPGAICSSCCEPTLLILGEPYREDLVSDVEWVSRKNSRLTCHFETTLCRRTSLETRAVFLR